MKSDWGKLAVKVPRIEIYEENNVRTGILEHNGYLGLWDTFPRNDRLWLVVGYHLGSRPRGTTPDTVAPGQLLTQWNSAGSDDHE